MDGRPESALYAAVRTQGNTAAGSPLYLCGARHYAPDEVRWTARDPISYAGGINVYSYVGNNPINGVDPSGLTEGWDLVFLAADGVALGHDFKTNAPWYVTGIDGAALTIDAGVALIPGVPTGAGRLLAVAGHSAIGAEHVAPLAYVGIHAGQATSALVRLPGHFSMLGGQSTIDHENEIANGLENEGWTITHGAGRGKQECIPNPAAPTSGVGRPKNAVFPDITAVKDGRTIRIQTVDVLRGGKLTDREFGNAVKIINRRPNDGLFLIPKRPK
jgi:RHS repeat-associated protein